MYLNHEWVERIIEDGIFEEHDDPEDWCISFDNIQELIEALNLDQILNESDTKNLIDKHGHIHEELGVNYI